MGETVGQPSTINGLTMVYCIHLYTVYYRACFLPTQWRNELCAISLGTERELPLCVWGFSPTAVRITIPVHQLHI